MTDLGIVARRHNVRRRVTEQASAPRREGAVRQRQRQGGSAPAVAGYIADMTAQLESMATAAGLDLLAYFLAMARAESEAAAQTEGGAPGEETPSI